jgi:hypothetical protein
MITRIRLRAFSIVNITGVLFSWLLLLPLNVGGGAITPLAFRSAAQQNSLLKNELKWAFGGRTQAGWILYLPLIHRLIGTDCDPDTGDFALALSRWQQGAGLTPNGILDHGSWSKMVAVFQSRRVRARSAAKTEQLFQAPPSNFYDPERPEELRYIDPQAFTAYQRMMAAAAADLSLPPDSTDKWLKIISAYRSPAYQAQLRRRNPRAGRAGLAIHSPHFTGRAMDLYVGGEPVSTRDDNRAIQVKTEVYQWLVKNAERFGFHPYFYEPWHWEYRP